MSRVYDVRHLHGSGHITERFPGPDESGNRLERCQFTRYAYDKIKLQLEKQPYLPLEVFFPLQGRETSEGGG